MANGSDASRYKILVLAPFDPDLEKTWDRASMAVTLDTLDEAIAALSLCYYLALDSDLSPAGGIEFKFENLKALHPDGMVSANTYLRQLTEAAAFVQKARRENLSADRISQELRRWPDLPAVDIPSAPPIMPSAAQASDGIDQLLQMVALPDAPSSTATAYTSPLEAIPGRIVATLLREAPFRRMESAWRGLRLLLQQDGDRSAFKVELASVQSETLDRVLENLTPHVTASPPALVVVDLPFDNTPLAIERLTACARWAAEMMLPVIAWAPAEMMLIDGWDKLSTLPYLPHHLQEAAHAKLRSLREAPEGHWLCLTCNRFLLRYPYGPDNTPRKVAVSEQEPLWISPVWGLAALIAQSVAQTGWPTRFTDRGQFRIQDLALHSVGRAGQLPAEMCPDADRRDQFIRSGFTPLAVETGRDTAFFPAAVMLSGTPLPYQLLVCQVSQFLLQCKELLPAENDPAALETQLRLAFQIFSERSNPPGLAEVQISAGAPDTNGKMALRVQLTPHASVLKSRQPIELAFSW